MGVSWIEIPGTIQSVLLRTTERLVTEFSQQHVSNIIYGYVSVLRVNDIRSTVFAFSFGVMKVNWRDLTIRATLYSEIERLSSEFNSQDCSNIILG
jgi:hypothetical protein